MCYHNLNIQDTIYWHTYSTFLSAYMFGLLACFKKSTASLNIEYTYAKFLMLTKALQQSLTVMKTTNGSHEWRSFKWYHEWGPRMETTQAMNAFPMMWQILAGNSFISNKSETHYRGEGLLLFARKVETLSEVSNT